MCSNDMDSLGPEETVQVVMFKVLPGRSLHIQERTPVSIQFVFGFGLCFCKLLSASCTVIS
jgi:hypothetical protein